MTKHTVVSHAKWLNARKELLAKEKEFSRLRDALSRQRRELPWEKVDKEYVFQSSDGREHLSGLFDRCSQLVVYHFMFDPAWDEGCKSCSFLADHYNPSIIHLKHRDVTMVTVSRAPWEKLEAFNSRDLLYATCCFQQVLRRYRGADGWGGTGRNEGVRGRSNLDFRQSEMSVSWADVGSG